MVQFFSQVLGNQRALSKKVQKPVQKWCRNGFISFSLMRPGVLSQGTRTNHGRL